MADGLWDALRAYFVNRDRQTMPLQHNAEAPDRITVPADQALGEWSRLRLLNDGWPLIIGGDKALAEVLRHYENRIIRDHTDQQQGEPPAPQLFAFGRGASLPDYAIAPEAHGRMVPGDALARLTSNADGEIHILILPVEDGKHVPTYLNMELPECPMPEAHAAALHKWGRLFGAELVSFTGQRMSIRVAQKPSTRSQAQELAREHYAYCPALLESECSSLAELATLRQSSEWWHFEWR